MSLLTLLIRNSRGIIGRTNLVFLRKRLGKRYFSSDKPPTIENPKSSPKLKFSEAKESAKETIKTSSASHVMDKLGKNLFVPAEVCHLISYSL